MTPDIEAILKEHIKLEQERVPGYAFHHWEAIIAGIPEASTAIQSLLAEKDAEIERLRKDKDWLCKLSELKDKEIASLKEENQASQQVYNDLRDKIDYLNGWNQKRKEQLREAFAEIDKLRDTQLAQLNSDPLPDRGAGPK
jgi:chromosome segregation ATPase